VPVRIRMKRLGRRHRPFFRICATDGRRPRDGRVLEELGTYDPMVPEVDARALINGERIAYWLSVGAQPSDKVRVLIKKYGTDGTHLKEQEQARAKLALPRVVPAQPEPAYVPPEPSKEEEAPAEPAAEATKEPAAEAATATPEAAKPAEATEPAAESAAASESTEAAEPAAEEKKSSEATAEGEKTE